MIEKIKDLIDRLKKREPFLAPLIGMLKFVEDLSIRTAAISRDGTVRYNPVFLLEEENGETVLMHELMHKLMHHFRRQGARDPRRWNVATDAAINDILDSSGYHFKNPENFIFPETFGLPRGRSADWYYDRVSVPQGFASRFMEESHSSEDSEGQEGHGAGQTEFEKAVDWYREQIRRGYGTSSSRILRGLADQLINSSVSKINWRELLKAYVQEFSSKKEQTFKRPNRRFALQGGLILPGKTRIPVISEPIVAVDVSGSVSDNWVRVGLQAAVEILSSEVASSVRVVQCDSEIVSEQLVTDPSEVDLGRHGAGGTSFAPPLARAEELGSPVVIYISEDLDGYFPPSCSVPVIWVTAPEAKVIPPFGVVVKVLAE